jgi:hypothetical protein
VRKRVLGKGEGDYCIYQIAPPGGEIPQGSLVPIPEVPRFESTADAVRWIKNDSGDTLAGKQVMVFRAMEILSIQVEAKPTVTVTAKPKTVVNDPTKEEA